ncbi:hypothetical protein GCM10022268_25360 [Sphingomonas cynarae]|uniref:DUF4365 domain-containing protein n=1 Tax=Sphingomonas cynarae TaxID=930197 RepID=A0ABP7EA93_9SPHN
MFDLWAAEHSVLREKVLERVFLTELSRVLLIAFKTPFEVLRSEFDANGYDVVVEARGIIRHIQLKATRVGGKRASVDVNLALAEKPGGCVVWFMADPATLSVGPFYWLGGEPGQSLAVPDGAVARHSRANASGVKGERTALRRVPMRRFIRMETVREVAEAMFGADHGHLLHAHLSTRGVDPATLDVSERLPWKDSTGLAQMIDGYVLAEAAGLGDPADYLARARAVAEATGQWRGSALELWVALFLEHRRDHFSGFLVGNDIAVASPPLLNELCVSLVWALRRTFPTRIS